MSGRFIFNDSWEQHSVAHELLIARSRHLLTGRLESRLVGICIAVAPVHPATSDNFCIPSSSKNCSIASQADPLRRCPSSASSWRYSRPAGTFRIIGEDFEETEWKYFYLHPKDTFGALIQIFEEDEYTKSLAE